MSPLREDESKSVCFSSGVIKGSYMVNQAVAACILSCEPHTTKPGSGLLRAVGICVGDFTEAEISL